MTKRHMLLHSGGTHSSDEKKLEVCSDDSRRCAKQNELRILELRSSKRDMQVADSVSTAESRADFVTLSTSSCSNKVCWNTCARYASRAHFVTYKSMQPRKVHDTAGSMARRGIDQCCEDTFSWCNFCCVHANRISGSESQSCPRHQCHADASCTSLTSAGFHCRKLVLLRWHSVFANTHIFSIVG